MLPPPHADKREENSLKKTTNYQLNLWELEDRILMDDFNADNAKIDAALVHKVPMTVIHDITVPEDVQQIDFDMKTNQWGQYSVVLLTLTPPSTGGGGVTFRTGTQDVSTAYHMTFGFSNTDRQEGLAAGSSQSGITVVFFPAKNPKAALQTLNFSGQQLGFGFGSRGYNSTIPLSLVGTLPAGVRIQITGVL